MNARAAEDVRPHPVTEASAGLDAPILVHEAWVRRMPWLVHGITWPGPDGDFDLGLAGGPVDGPVLERWRTLRTTLGMAATVHSRQVHGAEIRVHEQLAEGVHLHGRFDGHVTRTPGLALTISVADCVPVFMVDSDSRTVGLLHAGWRGVAAGIVEAGVRLTASVAASGPGRLDLHTGPAICGSCYEVGPEVFEQLRLPPPAGPAPLDLRAVVARQALEAGADPRRITTSTHCTRCGPSRFFSHRAGASGRQAAIIGIRAGD